MATAGSDDGEEWISDLLTRLCEDVGFSEEEWRLRLRTCDIQSTSCNYGVQPDRLLHSGSFSEGLSAELLDSDTDIMVIPSGVTVVENDEIHSNEEENDVYKAVPSTPYHPAFYKLAFRHAGNNAFGIIIRQCLVRDPHSHTIVLNGVAVKELLINVIPVTECWGPYVQHGPALTRGCLLYNAEVDHVVSLHCPSWPSVAEPWKRRLRQFDWPSKELIHEVTQLGCEFVPIGNPLSQQANVEWRLSSSAAERVLVRSLNIVQIQCYFLLKLVLVYLVKPQVPDAICSYHMKNIILWQVEKTDRRTWRRDNLVQRFTECVLALHRYLEDGNLPQYFIPQQNLFYPKIQGNVKSRLVRVVQGLLEEGWICLLKCLPFTNSNGECVHNVPRCPCFIESMIMQRKEREINELHDQLQNVVRPTAILLGKSAHLSLVSVIKTMKKNTHADKLYYPSHRFIDVLNTALANHMGFILLTVTRGLREQKNSQLGQILQSARRYLEDNCDADLTSCRLKLATFYYRLGQVHKCIRVVHDVLVTFKDTTMVLGLEKIEDQKNMENVRFVQCFLPLLPLTGGDIWKLLRLVSFPVLFSAWEIANAPPAVQSLRFNSRLESSWAKTKYDIVAIDSLVYAYYLCTISYREVGRHDQADKSLGNLRRILRHPQYYQIYYPEVAKQLLSHCSQTFDR